MVYELEIEFDLLTLKFSKMQQKIEKLAYIKVRIELAVIVSKGTYKPRAGVRRQSKIEIKCNLKFGMRGKFYV